MKLSLATSGTALMLMVLSETAPTSLLAGCAGRSAQSTGVATSESARIRAGASAASRERAASSMTSTEKDELTDARATERALDRVTPFAAVRIAPREMILTVESSVLFDRATARLMPTARARLDRIAQTLLDVNARSVVVRGYVDRSGDSRRDASRSGKRADAVRRYLIARGIAPGSVRAEGLGPDDPVTATAPNDPAVGRDDVPRIEIVVTPR